MIPPWALIVPGPLLIFRAITPTSANSNSGRHGQRRHALLRGSAFLEEVGPGARGCDHDGHGCASRDAGDIAGPEHGRGRVRIGHDPRSEGNSRFCRGRQRVKLLDRPQINCRDLRRQGCAEDRPRNRLTFEGRQHRGRGRCSWSQRPGRRRRDGRHVNALSRIGDVGYHRLTRFGMQVRSPCNKVPAMTLIAAGFRRVGMRRADSGERHASGARQQGRYYAAQGN